MTARVSASRTRPGGIRSPGRLSEDNPRWIQEYGKWELFDVSAEVPGSRITGKVFSAAQEIRDQFGQTSGLRIRFEDQCIDCVVAADDHHVFWESNDLKLFEWGMRVSNEVITPA